MVNARSVEGGLTTVVCVAELLCALGSAVDDATVAVLERSVSSVGVTFRTTVADAPAAIVPSEHAMVELPEHEPWLAVAEPKVTLPGSMSVSVAPAAAFGPAFETAMV